MYLLKNLLVAVMALGVLGSARAETAAQVLNRPGASREQIREHLSGNYCRCTGYQAIVDAVEAVLVARRNKT